MTYRALRKDLTEKSEKCLFCSKELKSLKAYVLQHLETNEIVLSGPECAKKNLSSDYTLKGIPDFTKFTDVTRSSSGKGSGGGDRDSNEVDSDKKNAIEYICLRELKLTSILNCSYPVLKKYYLSYLSGELMEDDVHHINNIEKKAPDSLKLSTLQKCYNYLFWIDIAISKLPEDKREFLLSIRNTVISCKPLSPKQFLSLNLWLKNVDGVPQLK